MNASWKIGILTVGLWFAVLPLSRAQAVIAGTRRPDLTVMVRTSVSGDATINAWSGDGGHELAAVLPEIVHCRGKEISRAVEPDGISCEKALRRDGLALEGVVDLAPIARRLDPSTEIQLRLDFPRLAIASSSVAMTEEGGGATRLVRSIRFQAGSPPPPIQIRFGYRLDQMAAIYLPLVALALALTLIATFMSRAGLTSLSLSAVVLGTIVWMGTAAQLQADGPLQIVLYGTPFANFASLLVKFWPPLLCVSAGVAIGNRMRSGKGRSNKAGEVLAKLAVIPLLLTCVAGIVLSVGLEDWLGTVIWLAAAPAILILRRSWLRAGGRHGVTQLRSGEFKESMSALAARAGCPRVKVFISFSKHSESLNAFALPRRGILFTDILVRSLSRREVNAIAAHELSHVRLSHSHRGIWIALCLALVLSQAPLTDLVFDLPGGLFAAMLLPIGVLMFSLHQARRREFVADAGSAFLTGDPRAMISSLARIAGKNNNPISMNPVAEFFSSHPSTTKRIRALAAAAKLDETKLGVLGSSDDVSGTYEIPQEQLR